MRAALADHQANPHSPALNQILSDRKAPLKLSARVSLHLIYRGIRGDRVGQRKCKEAVAS